MSNKVKGTIFAVLSASLFGLSPLWVDIFKSGGGTSLLLALFRNVFFLPVGYCIIRRSGRKLLEGMTPDLLRRIVILSVFGSGATQILLFSSYKFMASGICTTVHFTYPLFVFLAGAFFYGQKIDGKSAFCLGVCLAGLFCFYPRGGQISWMGLIIALLSGVTYAFYLVYMDKGGFEGLTSVQLQFWVAAVNALLVLVCCLLAGELPRSLTGPAWIMGMAAAQILGLGVVLCQMGLRIIGARQTSILSTFEPITSLIAGVLFLRERLDPMAVLGAAVILLSVLLFNSPAEKLFKKPHPAGTSPQNPRHKDVRFSKHK